MIGFILLLFSQISFGQKSNHALSIGITVDKKLLGSFSEKGRLFIFMSADSIKEPRTLTWPSPNTITEIFAKNIDNFDSGKNVNVSGDTGWISTADWTLENVPT